MHLFIWLCQVLLVAHRIFSSSTWDIVPWPGNEPGLPASGAQSLSHLDTGWQGSPCRSSVFASPGLSAFIHFQPQFRPPFSTAPYLLSICFPAGAALRHTYLGLSAKWSGAVGYIFSPAAPVDISPISCQLWKCFVCSRCLINVILPSESPNYCPAPCPAPVESIPKTCQRWDKVFSLCSSAMCPSHMPPVAPSSTKEFGNVIITPRVL